MKKHLNKIFILIFLFTNILFFNLNASAENVLKGYITNKNSTPIKLKISEIEKEKYFEMERDEDFSFKPQKNLKVIAELPESYSYFSNDNEIIIPKNTKFSGYISEITSPKKFNRQGYYSVNFNNVICPDGSTITLKDEISSKSLIKPYKPISHIGKTTLGLLGGAAIGSVLSYQLGGLLLATSTHGYSIAAGAAAGGLIGTIGGISAKGKDATIEPGQQLNIIPIDLEGLEKLSQIKCNLVTLRNEEVVLQNKDLNVEIINVKEKKNFFGDLLKVSIKFTNNSEKKFRLSNFYLRDSQGKEYSPSIIDMNQDLFEEIPEKETFETRLEYVVDYPKTKHWLVLKDSDFNKDLGIWKIKD